MSQIKEYNAQVGIPSAVADPNLGDAATRGFQLGLRGLSQASQDLGSVGQGMVKWGNTIDEHIKNYERALKIQVLGSDARQQLSDRVMELANDPTGFATHRQSFRDAADQIKQTQLEQITDPQTRLAYEKVFGQYFAHYDLATATQARKFQIKSQNADLLHLQDNNEREVVANLSNPEKVNQIVHDNAFALGQAASAGTIDADDAMKANIKFRDNALYAQMKNLIQNDPVGARRAILSGTYTLADGSKFPIYLNDPKQAQALSEAADRAIEQGLRRQDTAIRLQIHLEDRAMKQAQDQFTKMADALFDQGFNDHTKWTQLVTLLDQNRDSRVVTPETYRYYKNKVRADVIADIKNNEDYLKRAFATAPTMNPMEAKYNSRVQANVIRSYQDLVRGGMLPREAATRAENLGQRTDVAKLPVPSNLGLEGGKQYDLAELGAARSRLAAKGTSGELDPNGAEFTLKLKQLNDLIYANRYWLETQPTAKETELDRKRELEAAEADRIRRQQQLQGNNQQQQKKTRGEMQR